MNTNEELKTRPDFDELKSMLEKDKAMVDSLKSIPGWIIKYDQSNHQSSAGKAIRELINYSKRVESENQKLREQLENIPDNLREALNLLQERIDNPNARWNITSDLKECWNYISDTITKIEENELLKDKTNP